MNLPIIDYTPSYAVGIDLGGTHIKYGIISDRGEILYRNFIKTPITNRRDVVLKSLVECANECVMCAIYHKIEIGGIGIGCPGTIDTIRGIALAPTAHIPEWEDAPIVGYIQRELSQKLNRIFAIVIDNDANFMAFAEYSVGAGQGSKTMVGVTLGTGVGGGIILDGKIFHGAHFNGAELGHITVEAKGHPCSCGNRGCLEKYAGGRAFVEATKGLVEKNRDSKLCSVSEITPKVIFDLAQDGDLFCKARVDDMIFYLGAGLASIVHALSPEVIVIGGGISNAGDEFVSRIAVETKSRIMNPIRKHVKIIRAQLGNDAGIVGAAMSAMIQTKKERL